MPELTTILKNLPAAPGVYRMYNGAGELIYVGKAKNLKNRVRSYFQQNAQHSIKVETMVQQVVTLDYVITDNEVEALLLECNLIKQYKPKYNILLKDDKKYPWIGVTHEAFPRLFFTRMPDPKSKAKYFGPYTSSQALFETLQVVRKHFPLRQRRKPLFKTRPCMNYHIGQCLGPCQKLVSEADYRLIVHQVELFLRGKSQDLLALIETDMQAASEQLDFELAARLRDRYRAVEAITAQRQKMVTEDVTVQQDVIAMATDERKACFVVFQIREGKLINSMPFEIQLAFENDPLEVYQAFVEQYYTRQLSDVEDGQASLPAEILVQFELPEQPVIEAWLTTQAKLSQTKSSTHKKDTKISLTTPKAAKKRALLELALTNARELLTLSVQIELNQLQHDPMKVLIELQEALNLPDLPTRMECYDISHFQGSQTVASMVVFTDGLPDKTAYRRFKIACSEGTPNDFESMAEVINRRFSHAPDEPGWETPELVIIDGGKGQLSSAVSVLEKLDIQGQPIISLAKKLEEVFVPGRSMPVILPRDSGALFLLQQIRDEAHRFAITYHRTLRGQKSTQSLLDEIPGLGPKRREKLQAQFSTVEAMANASVETWAAVLGLSLAKVQPIRETLLKKLTGS